MHDEFADIAAAPVYVRVADALTRDIAAGRLVAGARLPPERVLAAQFGVSVGTLRKALARLAQRSLLRRVQGSGNYIDAAGIRDTVYAMFRLEHPQGGGLPKAQVLDVAYLNKPEDIPSFGHRRQASRVRRLRFLDEVPVAIEEIWLDGAVGRLTRDDVSDSLYQSYQTRFGLWILRAQDKVSIASVPGWSPMEFTPRVGQVTGYVERFSWAEEPEPVEFSRTWFDPDRAVYVQRLA